MVTLTPEQSKQIMAARIYAQLQLLSAGGTVTELADHIGRLAKELRRRKAEENALETAIAALCERIQNDMKQTAEEIENANGALRTINLDV